MQRLNRARSCGAKAKPDRKSSYGYHSQQMIARWINRGALGAGILLLFAALFFSTITLASGDYRQVLRLALSCSALAAALFAIPLIRGPMLWRFAGLGLLILDLLLVLSFTNRL